jgi:hypothetical protein
MVRCVPLRTFTRMGGFFCDLPHTFPIIISCNDRFNEVVLDVGRQ